MKNKVILVSSNQLGRGDQLLGENILETFFTILKQKEELPAAVFLYEQRGINDDRRFICFRSFKGIGSERCRYISM